MLIVPDLEAMRSKIQADPEYLGELPYIWLQNPQYVVRILVQHPPKDGTGKWYKVSRGRAVGIFSNW